MIRSILRTMITALFTMSATSDKGHTRAVEYMLAWLMIGGGALVLMPGAVIVGPTSEFLLHLMTEPAWGIVALTIGLARLTALIINGAWRRTPLLRFAGAALGLMWWTSQGAIYWIAVVRGGLPFPNLSIYPVFVFFEAYSCFRCGQDASALRSLSRSDSEPGGHG